MKRQPSIKTLQDGLNLDDDTAVKVRAILKADKVAAFDSYSSVQKLRRECLNPPSFDYEQETALNEALEMRGAEHFGKGDGDCDFTYLNSGDCYVPTLIRNNENNCWRISSVGDIKEARGW